MDDKYDALKQACKNYLDYLADEESNVDGDDDYENDIFEKAMELCMGEDIWDEVNGLLDARDVGRHE